MLQATIFERRTMNLLFNLFNSASNLVQNAVGINRTLDELIKDKDIAKAITVFQDRDDIVEQAIKEYNTETHKIRFKPDKQRKGKSPKITAKLSMPYQQLINEIENTFLYGNDPQWSQVSTGTNKAFDAFTEFLKNTRWTTTQRQLKRFAGAETEAAKLYYVYRDEFTNEPKVGIKVLTKSKGDEIRPLFDQYDNMLSFGHGYYLKEGTKTIRHFDIYYPNVIWRCRKLDIGWEIIPENNPIGKIPVIYVCQPEAWKGVQPLIDRIEELRSRVADVNDYVADPILKTSADIALGNHQNSNGGLPEAGIAGKGVTLPNKDSIFEYLTIDTAVDLKTKEIEDLDKCIKLMSMTPDLSFEALVAAGAPTGRALKRAMALGYMKRAKNIEIYSIAQDREANIIKAIIENILNISLKSEMDNLIVSCEFAEPFQDDVSEKINDIIRLKDANLISTETAISLVDYIKDPNSELARISKENQEKEAKEAEERGTMLQEFERNNQQKNEEEE